MTLKRFFSSAICAVLLLSNLTCHIYALNTSATSAVLMDVDSGRILYAQNPDKRMLIASTTKIMTALVAIENDTLSDVVTVKRAYTLAEGSSMYLKEGEKLTLETLLYGLLLCSGNDAALAVADHVGGSVDKFVNLMNDKAKELGMTNTSFANPNGLDDEKHYSTARDMALLAAAAMENETLVRLCSTRSVSVGGRLMSNHNKLLGMVPGCVGMKTGYTRAAGRTLVSGAQRGSQRLVAVTLQDGNDWADHSAMLEYGFSAFPARRLAVAGQSLRVLPVNAGNVATVEAVAAESFFWPVGQGEELTTQLELPDKVKAPLEAGEKLGEAIFSVNGQEVGRVDLLCNADVSVTLPEPVSLLRKFQNLMNR